MYNENESSNTTMFCVKCGKQMKIGNSFCGGCGAPINQQETLINSYDSSELADSYHESATEETESSISKEKSSTRRIIAIFLISAIICLFLIPMCVPIYQSFLSESPLIGKWEMAGNDEVYGYATVTLEFKKGGKFIATQHVAGEDDVDISTYRMDSRYVYIQQINNDTEEKVRYDIKGRKLYLTYNDGYEFVLTRIE